MELDRSAGHGCFSRFAVRRNLTPSQENYLEHIDHLSSQKGPVHMQEIADAVGVDQSEVARECKELCKTETFPKSIKLSALHETDFDPPLYDIWTFKKNANHKHFGNTHVGIVPEPQTTSP